MGSLLLTQLKLQGPVPEMLISVNPGLKFCSVYIPMHCLGWHFVLLLLYLVVKAQQYIVTLSCVFLDEKTMLEIWLNPGLNLTIFRGTRPRLIICCTVQPRFNKLLYNKVLSITNKILYPSNSKNIYEKDARYNKALL